MSLLAFAASSSIHAQDASTQSVVVTAARLPQPLSAVLADVSVVDRASIERSGASAVADVLATLPGIAINQNGGPASTTSVFIRGSETRHAAVYVDGVRIDSQATGGAGWEQIPLDEIERIEVLRGPAAAVYGSDAIGGVVQMFTRRGHGPARPFAALTLGSKNMVRARLGVSGSSGSLDYALSASQGRSDGFDARTAGSGANPDADGWRRTGAHARVGLQLNPDHRLEATLLAGNLRSRFDGWVPTDDDIARQRLRTASLAWHARWSDDAQTRIQVGESRNRYESEPDVYRTDTRLRDVALLHRQRLAVGQSVTATLERREDRLDNAATAYGAALAGKRHQNGIGLGWQADFGAHGVQANLRRDDDSEFGGKTTGNVAWGWAFLPQWRVSASAGTAFRVPTLYQRFSSYGEPNLRPETGRNVELGLRWGADGSEAALTAYRNRIAQLIEFGAPGPCADSYGCFESVGRARLQGVTLSGRTTLGGDVRLHGSLDWLDARNVVTDQRLPRRPREQARMGVDTRWAGWTLGADVLAAGARFDDAANTRRLGGYGLVGLVASRTLAPGWTLEGRLDNVGDKRYELSQGYATPGRQVQLTLRWSAP